MRLAILLSVIWFLTVLTNSFINLHDKELIASIIFIGNGPLILLWGIFWVSKGFKHDKKQFEAEFNNKKLSYRDKLIIQCR